MRGLLFIIFHPLPPEAIRGQTIGFTFATGTEVVLVPKAVGTARLEVEIWVGCGGNKLEHMAFTYMVLVFVCTVCWFVKRCNKFRGLKAFRLNGLFLMNSAANLSVLQSIYHEK